MRIVVAISAAFSFAFLFGIAGCHQAQVATEQAEGPYHSIDASVYAQYSPVKIDIMPLTDLVGSSGAEAAPEIRVYVGLIDASGSQRKWPGIFRFELYEYAQRSAEPKGRRIIIWPDIDLKDPAKNDEHWRDFLRAYQFDLEIEPENKRSYILQVTYLCPDGKRLSDEFTIRHPE